MAGGGDKPHSGLNSDRLRQEAFEQEAEALREDLVRYFAGGAVLDELGVPLRQAIQDALKQVVKEAVQGEDLRLMIRNQVRDTILSGLKSELAVAQPQIIAELKRELVPRWSKELKATMEQGFREAVRPEGKQSRQARQQEPIKSPDESPENLERRPLPVDPKERDREQGVDRSRVLKSVLILGSVVFVFLAWLLFRISRPEDTRDDGPDGTTSISEMAETQEDDQATPGQEHSADWTVLRNTWITRVETAKGGLPIGSPVLASLAKHSPAEQFECWFDTTAIRRLESLLAQQEGAASDLQGKLNSNEIFGSCVKDYSVPGLPVFGAQVVVHVALQRKDIAEWKSCPGGKRPNGIPDLAAFESDGKRGPDTYGLLNGYLTCAGLSSQLTIGEPSTAPAYLFTLYNALKELSQGDE